MSAGSLTRRGQRAAERIMTDTCTVRRPTGEAFNEETGQVEKTYDTAYIGKCKVQASTTFQSSAQQIGGTIATVAARRVDLPNSAPEALVNDEITIDVSRMPALVGTVLRVTSPYAKTFATAQRLDVQEL